MAKELEEMERSGQEEGTSAYDLLVSDRYFRGDMNIPPRGQFRMRPPPDFDDEDDEGEPRPDI